SVAKVESLLWLELKLLIRGGHVFPEATDRRLALERHPRCAPFPDGVGGVEAHHRVKVKATSSLVETPHKLNRVGGRGLVGHRPVSIRLPDNSGHANLRPPPGHLVATARMLG